jgi:hypothetical protein
MRTYDPPVKDYAFLLRHVIDAETVLEEVTGGAVGLDDAIAVIEGAWRRRRSYRCAQRGRRRDRSQARRR